MADRRTTPEGTRSNSDHHFASMEQGATFYVGTDTSPRQTTSEMGADTSPED